MKMDAQTFRITVVGRFGKIMLAAGVLGLLLSVVGYFTNSKQFYHSYLTAYCFWWTIVLGGLFFTLLHHLTGASWSVVLRRIPETLMATLPALAVLFIPLLFGLHDLYHWSHADAVAADALLAKKAPYLNSGFFIVRTIGYFVIWYLLARSLYKISLAQDHHPSDKQTHKMRRLSAPGMLLFALTLTFASFDWLMSLDAHWFSTIFGVYIFSGTVLAVISFVTLFALMLRTKGILKETITVEHYHDLGKLLFGFTVFWAYIAFSQYFLIWYANIPEETIWFQHRWQGSWKYVSLLIVFGHFVLPFLVLLGRAAKRNLKVMTFMGCWMLFIHWVDFYWLVFPNLHHHGIHISWMDFTSMLAVGGVTLWYFWRRLTAQALVPCNDPKLQASINFENA